MPSKRPRSPKHPSHGLEAAIAKVDEVFQSHGSSEFDAAALAAAMGYDSHRSGAALAWISTVKQYALIDTPSLGAHRVSDLAKDVLLAEGDEHWKALVTAADSPPVFQKIRKQFAGAKTPPAKQIESWLLRENFTKNTAPKCARVYLETESFMASRMTRSDADPSPRAKVDRVGEPPEPVDVAQPTTTVPPISGALYDGNAFTLTSLKPLTKDDFEAIKILLDAQKMVAPPRNTVPVQQGMADGASEAAG